jgi:CheY-like chemotaxis protein
MSAGGFRHIETDTPRVMVVDGSKVARMMIGQLLHKELPGLEFIACETGAQAKEALLDGTINLVTTALQLPDMDGLELAKFVREFTPQAYIPIFGALATFIRGYVNPEDVPDGEVLYVEDSRVVAVATRRMLEKHGLKVTHVTSVEDALTRLHVFHEDGTPPPDVLLTDVYLKGELTGSDLLVRVRNDIGYNKAELPIIVMTGDSDPANQSELLRKGANDLVEKPIEERMLITKLMFQLRVGRLLRSKYAAG